MKVIRQQFVRMLQNSVVFNDTKASTEGLALWTAKDGRLRVQASDDFVVIEDYGDYTGDGEGFGWWYMTVKESKDLIKDLNASDSVTFEFGAHDLNTPSGAEWIHDVAVGVEMMMDPDYFHNAESTDLSRAFAIRPERFRKFSLLKTDDDYPIDFVMGEIVIPRLFTRQVLRWKCGPTLNGVLAPILRTKLWEEFKDQPEVLW